MSNCVRARSLAIGLSANSVRGTFRPSTPASLTVITWANRGSALFNGHVSVRMRASRTRGKLSRSSDLVGSRVGSFSRPTDILGNARRVVRKRSDTCSARLWGHIAALRLNESSLILASGSIRSSRLRDGVGSRLATRIRPTCGGSSGTSRPRSERSLAVDARSDLSRARDSLGCSVGSRAGVTSGALGLGDDVFSLQGTCVRSANSL
jgi:hypothetical protein